MAPLFALAGLVLAQPFVLQASVEAETRAGRLATREATGIGAEFSVEPAVAAAYGDDSLRVEANYSPRFFTRAHGLGTEDILVLHRAAILGRVAFSERLRVTLELHGTDGQVDFANALSALDAIDVDDETLEAVDQSVIEYTRGQARVGLRWQPARLWSYHSSLSAIAYRGRQDSEYVPEDRAGLRDQEHYFWVNRVERQVDRDTTWGGTLDLSYRTLQTRSYGGVTVTGLVQQHFGQRTSAEVWLGAHAPARERDDGRWVWQPGLPAVGAAAEHVFPVAANRRLTVEGRLALEPYFDSIFGRVDARLVTEVGTGLVLSDALSALASAEWAQLVHLWREGRAGQAEHLIDASVRFAYRPSSALVVEVGFRYASRLYRQEVPGPLTTSREELVAFVVATLSSELLGD